MNRVTYLQVMSELDRIITEDDRQTDYKSDIKDLSYNDFRWGWNQLIAGKPFKKVNFRKLTWQNLGQRMADRFGEQSDEDIRYVFQVIQEDFNRNRMMHLNIYCIKNDILFVG